MDQQLQVATSFRAFVDVNRRCPSASSGSAAGINRTFSLRPHEQGLPYGGFEAAHQAEGLARLPWRSLGSPFSGIEGWLRASFA